MPWRTSARERAQERGWSMAELARRLGIDEAYISRVLSGQQKPSMRLSRELERLFPDCHPRELIWWEEEEAVV